MSTADPNKVQCKELSEGNEQAREDMSSGEHGQGVKSVGEGNTTITHAKYTNRGGVTGLMRASSRAVIHQYDNTFNPGLSTEEKRAKADSNNKVNTGAKKPCGDHQYQRAFMHPHTSHTEARILEDIFKASPTGGGSLLLSIDWPGGEVAGKSPKSPCDQCQALICAAAKCIDIKICDEKDKPQERKRNKRGSSRRGCPRM